uniref:NAD(P)H-quinone oxidoreductase subunit 6, chloroplastic n=1 Tax=Chlorokybus atmophyticus TaxID=3144 RepID=NU6C_CHLAT|nr:NADH dehydrogenase subunit 6 [Chlorokybus atmophyticus]Q19V56.2 RecName: Full=NAD(P)H-quinone oxidoreductase subunit 6, chloroplastic; AltName: Full=NAD(P)H dehydrogenase subunit 6; AltName: Full=NADH-plastoquinone oxidoreductase subunit 6 [Chlorokybus atmophyticus]ABD62195.2 subunit 6 of NADH-plastoquinone oxidoreductase [Chlorokybus atmophyticus]
MILAEGVQKFSLFFLEGAVLVGALGVVLLPNILYSAFLLGGVLMSIAGIYLLLNADFVAAAQVLIYVGAINVLILFAIMLVNKNDGRVAAGTSNSSGVTNNIIGLTCIGLAGFLIDMIVTTPWLPKGVAVATSLSAKADSTAAQTQLKGSISIIGLHIFSDFLLPFEVISLLLLVTLVGAIVIARRERLSDLEISKISLLNLPDPSNGKTPSLK